MPNRRRRKYLHPPHHRLNGRHGRPRVDMTSSRRLRLLAVCTVLAAASQAGLATPTNITAATGIVLSGVTHTGAVIPTVSAVTGLTAANLDAAVSSRMATYAQPTGFLAASFPASIASPTNITAGVITTATNVTTASTSRGHSSSPRTASGRRKPASRASTPGSRVRRC